MGEMPSLSSRNVDKALPSYQPVYEPALERRIVIEDEVIRGDPGSSAPDRVRDREREAELQRRIRELEDQLRSNDQDREYQESLKDALMGDLDNIQGQNAELRRLLDRQEADRRAALEDQRKLNILVMTLQGQLEEWRANEGNERMLQERLRDREDEIAALQARDAERLRQINELESQMLTLRPVSYTHLTLPTIYSV
eukprot:TRINITY_DN20753_c0_g1_i1.p1 TRINITY_DN20753_c0_g1~~TRINITY_DN20753_c0_g1_i1.p1  ORF type:complete len:198 (-),score=65.26 TRINITY_DN20753_c0_g1_i1:31-624(-)